MHKAYLNIEDPVEADECGVFYRLTATQKAKSKPSIAEYFCEKLRNTEITN